MKASSVLTYKDSIFFLGERSNNNKYNNNTYDICQSIHQAQPQHLRQLLRKVKDPDIVLIS